MAKYRTIVLIAAIGVFAGATDANGVVLSLGDLLNTEKAITCIMGIFLSVAVAFFFGTLVMWIARVILTFTYNRFIGWIARGVVLFGTGLLAFSFASNDLVNFVGVPLTGLDAYNDYMVNGEGDAHSFLMTSLMESAHTPALYLVLAGVVMVLALVFSPKAQNVVRTSVDLSRQDEGDEMFGSSSVARTLVRSNFVTKAKTKTKTDELFTEILRTADKAECWQQLPSCSITLRQ